MRVQPVPISSVSLPPGISAGRAIDISFSDESGGAVTSQDRDVEIIFKLTDADLVAAGNDPARIAIFRIDPVTGVAQPLICDVDLTQRIIRARTRRTSSFVLGRAQQGSPVVYRSYATNLVKNGNLVGGSSLAANAVSSVTLKNDANTGATVNAMFFRDDGTKVISNVLTVPAGQAYVLYLPNITDLPNGNYSAVFEATQDIKVVANTGSAFGGSGPAGSSSMQGLQMSQAGRQQFVPGVYKGYFGFTSLVRIQATDLTAATRASINVISTSGSTILTDTRQLTAGGSTTFDMGAVPAVPSGFVGSVVVNSDRDVLVSYYVTDTAGALSGGTSSLVGATQAYAPSIYNNYFGYDSSIVIQNTGQGAANIEVAYSDGSRGAFTIPTGNTRVLFTPNEGPAQGFFGGAVIRSTNGGEFIATVNVRNAARGSLDVYDAVTSGSGIVSIPALYKNYAPQQFVSSVTLQNLGRVATDIILTFENGAIQPFRGVPAGGSVLSYQPNITELPEGYNRGAVVTNTAGVPIAVIVNIDANSASLPAGDFLFAYRGFNS